VIEIHDTPQGRRELGRIGKLNILSGLEKTMLRALLTIRGHAKENYLTGPRPQKLGVVSNVLRSSLYVKAETHGQDIIGTIGTHIWYGYMWEVTGNKRVKTGPQFRPFLRPAIEDKKAEVFKQFEVEIVRRVNE